MVAKYLEQLKSVEQTLLNQLPSAATALVPDLFLK